jgi:hypothetical protein
MRNLKTTALGVITILISALTVTKSVLEGTPINDIAMHLAAVTAGWGLIVAKDNTARL